MGDSGKNTMGFIKILWKYINLILGICSAIPNILFLYGIIMEKIRNPLVIWSGATFLISLSFIIYIFIKERKLKTMDEKYKTLFDNLQKLVEDSKKRDAFHYTLKNGFLYPSSQPGVRNVALRVESIQIILENIPINDDNGFSTWLKYIGREVARNYYKEVLKGLAYKSLTGDEVANKKERIKGWLEEENHSAWGNFILDDSFSITSSNNRIETFSGRIIITNSFLSIKRDIQSRKLCPFLCGYIEGIISNIFRSEVCVTERTCGCEDDLDGKCTFDFKSVS